jgi:protein TonB
MDHAIHGGMRRGPLLAAAVAVAVLPVVLAAAGFLSLPSVAGPANGGGPAALSLNAYFPADFTDAGYAKIAMDKVLKVWKPSPPLPAAGRKAVVISTILRDGKLLQARLHMGSGSKAFDEAAVSAVKKAAPFAPLPKGYTGSSAEVHWHFLHGAQP